MKIKVAYIFFFIALFFHMANLLEAETSSKVDQKKINEGKKLFLDIKIAIMEERFEEAHNMAERLIQDYAGDYQIDMYLNLYSKTFYLLDEDYRNVISEYLPKGLKERIKDMKSKEKKTALDIVKIVVVGTSPTIDNKERIKYLSMLIKQFPNSIWKDWAEWELMTERIYRPKEKYQDKSDEEKQRLLIKDLFNGGKKYIEQHPGSYMLPTALGTTSSWGAGVIALEHSASQKEITMGENEKDEIISMSKKVLREYPQAGYYCVRARDTLRSLKVTKFQEINAFSEQEDKIIRKFYLNAYEPSDSRFKNNVKAYMKLKKEKEKLP